MGKAFVCERFALSAPAGSVDRAAGVVRNVRVIGPRSRNGRKYPPAVTARHAALFDGAAVNLGHHFEARTGLPAEVPPQARFGRLANPRAANGGVVADLMFNPKHPFAESFAWAVTNAPEMYSFSALQRVRWQKARDADGDQVAEAILEVSSVDLVCDGATTSSVFESFTREANGSMFPVDPAEVAKKLTGPGMTIGFVVDLLNAVDLDDAGWALVLNALAGFTPPGATATATAANPALDAAIDGAAAESRRRVGATSVKDLVSGFGSELAGLVNGYHAG